MLRPKKKKDKKKDKKRRGKMTFTQLRERIIVHYLLISSFIISLGMGFHAFTAPFKHQAWVLNPSIYQKPF